MSNEKNMKELIGKCAYEGIGIGFYTKIVDVKKLSSTTDTIFRITVSLHNSLYTDPSKELARKMIEVPAIPAEYRGAITMYSMETKITFGYNIQVGMGASYDNYRGVTQHYITIKDVDMNIWTGIIPNDMRKDILSLAEFRKMNHDCYCYTCSGKSLVELVTDLHAFEDDLSRYDFTRMIILSPIMEYEVKTPYSGNLRERLLTIIGMIREHLNETGITDETNNRYIHHNDDTIAARRHEYEEMGHNIPIGMYTGCGTDTYLIENIINGDASDWKAFGCVSFHAIKLG